MADYKLTEGGVIRTGDGARVPDASGNKDWIKYQDWLGKGGTPDPADPLPEPGIAPLSAEELYDMLETKGVLVPGDRPRPKP